ncbi:single-stranded DNA-binding protein [uncultured Slackia sp.]|uniref:single-stranded DNA-binding protein n=1 Tax=uncultured Slackia sp. TaxID=665903 RepID=UPI0025EB4490|nr:single-stranded DNA-binding protein [uncultured Slackia sp.]
MSINKVVITGNLTRDPELRETPSGFQILSFGVAVNDRRKNQQTGQYEDYANFVDCTMFGNRAASVSRFLAKGSKVAIEGKLRWSQWEAQDGGKRSKLEVVVDELEFMSRDGQQQGQQRAQGMQRGTAQAYASMGVQPQAVAYDDEIPF